MKVKQSNKSTKKTYAAFIWALIASLLMMSVALNVYFFAYPVQLRLIGWLAVLGLISVLALYTPQGQQFKMFAHDAKNELQKVLWPTRQEAIQATLSVIVMAGTAGFALWLIDAILIWLISKITA